MQLGPHKYLIALEMLRSNVHEQEHEGQQHEGLRGAEQERGNRQLELRGVEQGELRRQRQQRI